MRKNEILFTKNEVGDLAFIVMYGSLIDQGKQHKVGSIVGSEIFEFEESI